MASGGHILQNQRLVIETQLKRAINQTLKDLCREYGKAVSGNKAELQRRCIDILNGIAGTGDPAALDAFKFRLSHNGQAPPTQSINSPTSTYGSPAPTHNSYSMAPGRGNYGGVARPSPNRYFKPNPFYEIVDTVLPLTDIPEMVHNKNTVRSSLSLNQEQSQRLAGEGMKLVMFCGAAQGVIQGQPADIAFPNQIEVKVNNDDVKHNYKGLKGKAGSTKPADLTDKIRAKANYPNQINITYALTTKRFVYCIYMVRYVSAAVLTERIKTFSIITKDQVIREMRRANADPEIEATSTRMSLRDPVSTVRITLPVRSSHCSHTQCFDGAMFMQLVEQAPQWNCPVCNKTLQFTTLCVDKYFQDILDRTPTSIEKVDVEPNGEWKMIKEEEPNTNGAGGKARAPYDDDFDDDIVELDGPENKAVNGVKKESQPSFNFNTPPLSSREPSVAQSTASAARPNGKKRPANAIIDLTLSDDDEQPIRPAKRHAPSGNNNQGTSSSHLPQPQQPYNTPSSLPDHSRLPLPQPPSRGGHRQADSYRPLSSDNYGSSTFLSGNVDGFRLANGDNSSYRPPSSSYNNNHLSVLSPPPNTRSPFNLGDNSNLSSTSDRGSPFSLRPPPGPWQQQQQHEHSSRTPSFGSLPPPNSNGPPPFAIRPPPSPTALSQYGVHSPELPPGGRNAPRLPPMQTEPPSGGVYRFGNQQNLPPDGYGTFNGWRSDNRYSDSPG